MRTAIPAFCVLAAIALAGCSSSDSSDSGAASATGATKASAASAAATSSSGAPANLTAHTWTGTERFPVPGVGVRFTSCTDDSELGTATTGRDGNAGQNVPAGCYRATVTSVPSGCQADTAATQTTDVKLDEPATLEFLIHCA
ncbi:hypothetical protein BJY24_001746 [Nocardia transvalensis]|uniref:Uncharacterized protein n=1 Tax=Nocardia transvalensis TaxID=37333 RepID=A0A7W9PB85_9NOCA|nr:hypothetical protein [Nocardia transvalensis]MBB5912879.1 hypothetical protein [Nocardia transvalensis]